MHSKVEDTSENRSVESSMEDLRVASPLPSPCFDSGHNHHNGRKKTASPRDSSSNGMQDLRQETLVVRGGLSALRDDHYNLLARIRDDQERQRNKTNVAASSGTLKDRISHVTTSLEKLEVGIEESSVMLALSEHFNRLEADSCTLRLEMERVVDENDWLREELSETQKRLIEVEAQLAEIREEKRHWEFMEDLKNVNEITIRPITPSRIPVGKYRVEVEKDINRAMSTSAGSDSSRTSRSSSPAPSRIPTGNWRNKLSTYKKVMEKQEMKANHDSLERSERQYFKLNGEKQSVTANRRNNMSRSSASAHSGSKIPSR